jgi:17beta-estradiol 17-dehydrogenase / 3beta-hydroxysteroid 3-dehydrogenase
MSGHRVVVGTANHFYSATKHAVKAITEGIRQELRELNTNIRVAVS